MIVPQSDVILLKVPLELNDLNQLTFANATAQYNYFNGLTGKLTVGNNDFTYQRKDSTMRVPALMDDILSYNYCMYRNDAYSNKWFYAFIEDMEYLNDNVTAVRLKTDVWQTWQFDLTYKSTFVAREHTNDDTIGANTQPESLETGEPVINGEILHMAPSATGYYITFMVSDTTLLDSCTPSLTDASNQYNGIFSGYTLFGVKDLATAQTVVKEFVNPTGLAGSYADAIKNIFLVPKPLYGTITEHSSERFGVNNIVTPQKLTVPVSITDSQTIARITTLDGYTPKNNKLYTWPYSYLFVTNNVGGNVEYRYEDFTSATPTFQLGGIISSGCDIKLKPKNYKNISGVNQVYGLKMSKLPVCSWNTDSYAIWMAQNELNLQVSLTRNTLKGLAGVATSNPELIGGAIGSYGGDLLNSLSEKYIAQHTPDEVHGDPNSSDFNFSSGLFFDFRRMSVRAEYARVIDDYFSAVGYATNRVKIPNITGRRNWNYVKTVGCYIEADIPQADLNEIKSMFDKGITLWHNPATFADYSQTNDILTT